MRTKRAALSFFAGTLQSVLTLLVGFVATPWILRGLGQENYGAFRTLLDWTGYLSLLEFGLFGSLMTTFSLSLSKGDHDTSRKLLVSSIRQFTRIYFYSLVLGIVALPFITHLIPVDPTRALDLRIGLAITLVGLSLNIFQPFHAFYEASQQGYRVHLALTLRHVCFSIFAVVFARLEYGITGQCLAGLFSALIFVGMLVPGINRKFPNWHSGVFRFRGQNQTEEWKSRKLRRFRGPTFAVELAGRFSFMSDNVILAAFLGPAAVAPYILTQRLILTATTQLQNIGNSTWAGMAQLHEQGTPEQFQKRAIELTKWVAALSGTMIVALVPLNRFFVQLWVGKEQFGGDLLTFVTALNGYVHAVLSTWLWLLAGTGRIRISAASQITQAVLNILLSVGLTHYFGLIGPALGTLAAFVLVSSWWTAVLLKRAFGIRIRDLAVATLPGLLLSSGIALSTHLVLMEFYKVGWVALCAIGAANGGIYLLLAFCLMFNADEKQLILSRLPFRRHT